MITQWNQSHEESLFHSPIIEIIDLRFIVDAVMFFFWGGGGESQAYTILFAFDLAHIIFGKLK